jgi:hypothetical protein
MMIDKRIWKTGVLAVVITLIGSMFVMRLDEWSRGMNSDFLVYGQTSPGTGGGTGGSGTTAGITKIIPQIALGSYDNGVTRYTTYIQVINTGSTTATVSGSFYNPNGTPSTAPITALVDGVTSSVVGTLAPTSLAVNRSLVLTATSTGAGVVNWGSITSTGSISVAAAFELRESANNTLLSRVGIAASPADMKEFVIPRSRNAASGLDVGFAVVNTGATSAVTTVVLRDAAGATLATKDLTLAAKSQTAVFAREFFGAALTDPAGTNFQYMTFTSTSFSYAALALAIEGANLASFPVDRLQ